MEKLKIKSNPRPILFAYDKLAHKTVNVSPAHICEHNLESFNTAILSVRWSWLKAKGDLLSVWNNHCEELFQITF